MQRFLFLTPPATFNPMSINSGRRGEYAKTAQRREDILDAAFSVFSRNGFINASMSEIAKRVGLTLPGLTHHFPTKATLLEAVIRRRDLDANTHLEGRHGLDLIRGLIEIAERDEKDLDLTQLFAMLSAEATDIDHPAHEYFRGRYEFILENVERGFAEAERAGQLRPGVTAAEAARIYVALSDGLQLQGLYARGAFSQSEFTRRALDSLVLAPSAPITQ
jgi:AcrR family transcriptional regulator